MSYTNATFYLDLESGSDTARADLVPTAYANNGSGLVRVTCNSTASYSTGAVFDIAGTTGSVYIGGWIVTIIDGTHVDLQGSAFTSNPAAKGTMIPRGGSSKTDAWRTVASGASSARTQAGDTIRAKGTAAPTSIGNATWTNGPLPATVAIVSSTNATPIVVTVGSGHGIVTGDTVICNAHATNTKANGVWKVSVSSNAITLLNADGTNSVGNGIGAGTGTLRKYTNGVVILASALTKSIAVVGNQGTKANWTPSANVTCTVITTDFKEGGECQQISIAGGFATGLAAYFPTGTLNLSTYQQVTFWVKQTSGTIGAAAACSLKLCTDTVGATPVHTVDIPALGSLNQWTPVTVDLATNLNSAIASINFTVNTDNAAQIFLIDCVHAVKASASADSLSLTSLVGKNTGTETFYAIGSINDVRVVLDATTNTIPSSTPSRGYTGTTATATTYKRETFATTLAAAAATAVHSPAKDGSSGSVITFSGGWDRTNMTTQDGLTWLDGRNGLGIGIALASRTFVTMDKFCTTRFSSGVATSGSGSSDNIVTGGHHNNNTSYGISYSAGSFRNLASPTALNNNGIIGFSVNDGALGTVYQNGIGTVTDVSNNASSGIEISAGAYNCGIDTITRSNNNGGQGYSLINGGQVISTTRCRVKLINDCSGNAGGGITIGLMCCDNEIERVVQANNNTGAGVTFGGSSGGGAYGNRIGYLSTSGNTTRGVSNGGINFIANANIAEATVAGGEMTRRGDKLYLGNFNGVYGDNRQYTEGGTIFQQTVTKHGSDNFGWKYTMTGATRTSWYPLEQLFAPFAAVANKLVTVSRWYQRDNTGLTLGLVLLGGQVPGVNSDVSAFMTAAINTWEQLTITFTPTANCTVQLLERAYGASTYNGYSSDWSIAQAA